MRDIKLGKLKGRFVVHWVDEDGRRRRYRLAADTVSDAEREALDVYRRETSTPAGPTVSEIWGSYIRHLGSRPTAKTMTYTGKAVLSHFGGLRPDQITTDHCRAYTAQRLSEGRSAGSVWTELGHLQIALNWAHKKARITDMVPHIERPQKPAPKDRHLSSAEIARLLEAATEPHIRLAILLMLSTAGRVSAILELTWNRVDFDRGVINLRKEEIGPRKGRAVVPMNAGLRAALQDARRMALTDHVVEWGGSPVRSIRTGFDATVRRAGLRDVSPHVLRHTSAVRMAEAGLPMSQIAQYLGHSSTSVTERVYARYSPDYLRAAADVLDFTSIRPVQEGQ